MERLNECNCDAHKKKGALNYCITRWRQDVSLVWRPDQLETRWIRENQHPAEWALRPPIEQLQLGIRRVGEQISWEKMLEWEHVPERLGPQAPGRAAQENGKETQLWPIEWGSKCCSSARSPNPSNTQPFQIIWEVYFSKRLCRRLYCVICMHASAYEIQHRLLFSTRGCRPDIK